ncbi:hypothetical protein BJX76DRAFT_24623 [Aspergillus varians]
MEKQPTGDGLNHDRAKADPQFQYQINEGDRQQPSTTSAGGGIGGGVMGIFAGIHGAGEWLRGGINAAVDRAFGSTEGVTKNEAISRAGQEEIRSGRFSQNK